MRNSTIILFMVMQFFTGCKKESTSNTCVSLTPEPLGIGWNYIYSPNSYSAPCFNPINAHEFCLIKRSSGVSILCSYNMQTKSLLPLYTGNILYHPSWSINNWILFDVNNNIYKIKSTGDSLTRLISEGANVWPNWLPNGMGFTFNWDNGQSNDEFLALSNGEVIDSFNFNTPDTNPFLDTTFISVNATDTTSFTVINKFTSVLKKIPYQIDISTYSGPASFNSSTFIWSDKTGIYTTNWQNGQTVKLKDNCDAISYLFPSYSSISNKVIWGKTVRTASGNNLTITNTIVMMNADGSGEQEIMIP